MAAPKIKQAHYPCYSPFAFNNSFRSCLCRVNRGAVPIVGPTASCCRNLPPFRYDRCAVPIVIFYPKFSIRTAQRSYRNGGRCLQQLVVGPPVGTAPWWALNGGESQKNRRTHWRQREKRRPNWPCYFYCDRLSSRFKYFKLRRENVKLL